MLHAMREGGCFCLSYRPTASDGKRPERVFLPFGSRARMTYGETGGNAPDWRGDGVTWCHGLM